MKLRAVHLMEWTSSGIMSSFTLQGYQKNGVDVVYSVTFMDDTVKTKEGIKIGDSKDKSNICLWFFI